MRPDSFARERHVIYIYYKEKLQELTTLWLATQPKLSAEVEHTTQMNKHGTETVNMWAEENYFKVCKDTACAFWGHPFDLLFVFIFGFQGEAPTYTCPGVRRHQAQLGNGLRRASDR